MIKRTTDRRTNPRKVMFSCSVLAADFTILAKQIRACEKASSEYLHIDVMDGNYVPNFGLGFHTIEAVRRLSKLPLDAHLMLVDPAAYLDRFIEAGCAGITFHAETTPRPRALLAKIKRHGLRAGIAFKPDADPEQAREFLGQVDVILQMTVFPGFYGQSFIDAALPKIAALRKMIDEGKRSISLQVDGGINQETIARAVNAGADFIVAGSSVFRQGSIGRSLAGLRRQADGSTK
jgi:ribulose-phosphate 3-epimerase